LVSSIVLLLPSLHIFVAKLYAVSLYFIYP
jgi:hypothetical protein